MNAPLTIIVALAALFVVHSASAAEGNCGKGKGTGNACLTTPVHKPHGGNATGTGTANSTSNASAAGGTASAVGGTSTNNVNGGNSSGGASDASVRIGAERATAYAPAFQPTANCALGTGIGVQGGIGVSLGTSHVDENCATIETAKAMHQLGKPWAAHEILCELPKVRAARERSGDPCLVDTVEYKAAHAHEPTDPYVRKRLGLD